MTSPGTYTRATVRKNRRFAKVSLNKSTGQKSIQAIMNFSPGDVICQFRAGTTQAHADRYTLQINTNKHITLLPDLLQYTNHSCDPNVFFNTTTMKLISLKTIEPGDELTFFYPSTEWEMAEPFKCRCSSTACLELIKGASSLSVETMEKYKLTDFIRQMIRRKLSL